MKAFDSVPRETLFAVLRRFGLLDHFVKVLIRIHYGAKFKIKIGEVDPETTRTRTNANLNDTEANAVGRRVRACVARESKS